jgi:FKBP-type peptidyl-prolyl cis-trans isomerase FklB
MPGLRGKPNGWYLSMKTRNESTFINCVSAGAGIFVLIAGLAACDPSADSDKNTGNGGTSPAYNAGYEFGIRLALFQQQQPGTGPDQALKGMCDALSDTDQTIGRTEICARLKQEAEPAESVQTPQAETSIETHNDDSNVLDAGYEVVIELPSGVQYQVLQAGGGEQPQAGDAVTVSYKTYLDDGSVFGSTNQRRISLDDIAVPGLKEALLLMNEGARWQVVVPPNMGFTKSGNRTLRRSNLTYDIELISIEHE